MIKRFRSQQEADDYIINKFIENYYKEREKVNKIDKKHKLLRSRRLRYGR